MSAIKHFFDYLDLKQQDFSQTRLIVFTGKSGAGKSSYIDYLAKTNVSLKNRFIKIHSERPMNWRTIQDKNQTLIIDEVKRPIELYHIIRLLINGNSLLVANHIPSTLFKILCLFTKTEIFNLDQQTKKITHYLRSHGYQYSQPAVEAFCKMFGSNYLKLEIILETGEQSDFDVIFNRFIRFNKIQIQQR